jgi:hypothetical protein
MRIWALGLSPLVCAVLWAADEKPASAPVAAPMDLLDRARAANDQLYSTLESFVCNERIARYHGPLHASTGRQIDTVTARVSFENGEEHYTLIRQNQHPRSSISAVAGAWSEGEFGSLLRQTEALLMTQPVTFLGTEQVEGSAAALYSFDVSEDDSPWDLEVASEHYRVPFHTDVWVAPDSGEILKIARRSTTLSSSSHISELRWSVTLAPVELNGHRWLLPRSGEYSVAYEESGQREWNELQFSDYHRYGSEASLRFDRVK